MKYYNGLNDIVFKNTFCTEEHKGLLKWLLESCLDMKVDNIILKDKELNRKSKYSKGRIVDLLIESGNILFNVEINNQSHSYTNDRNLGYLANLYGSSIDRSIDYKSINPCIQLNITSGKKGTELRSKYLMVDVLNKSRNVWTDKFVIYEINVDLLRELYYNNDIESIEKYKPIVMLFLNKKELKEFSKGDARIMEYSKKVEALNSDDEFKIFISEEEDREKSENALKTIIKETQAELKTQKEELRNKDEEINTQREEINSQKEEINTQKEEIKKLKLQETKLNNIQIETARKLKDNNVDIKIISDTTGLSLEEIEKL